MTVRDLLDCLGDEIDDPDTETFLLFSQERPSSDLGFVDAKAHDVEVVVGRREYTIYQSPTILSSHRAEGTTGAVLWKIARLFSSWLSQPTSNILFQTGVLSQDSVVLELGCGISPLNGLATRDQVRKWVLTDQVYVQKLVERNIAANSTSPPSIAAGNQKKEEKKKKKHNGKEEGNVKTTKTGIVGDDSRNRRGPSGSRDGSVGAGDVAFQELDWETDQVTPHLTGLEEVRSFDAVVACDCIYNYALVEPLVQTCADACMLRERDEDSSGQPCLCVVAQQLRSDEVFEAWLTAFCKRFSVFRVPDSQVKEGFQSTDGFVVHVGVLRGQSNRTEE